MSSVSGRNRGFPIFWIVLFAVLAAFALEDAKAAWLGALAGYLFGRLLGLERAIAELTESVETLSARAKRGAVVAETSDVDAGRVSKPSSGSPAWVLPPREAIPEAEAVLTSDASALQVAVQAAESRPAAEISVPSAGLPPPPPKPAASPRTPGSFDHIEAWLKRGNPLARLGVLITFFGAVFLIKYAAEEGYLPIEWRLASLAAGALAMSLIGWRLREKVRVYALTLQGGGLALLYLTVLAAFRLYTLLPGTTALSLMMVAAAASAALAVRQNALSLAVTGFAGGFVAPLLIGGDGSHIALFGYYTVLNLGIFAIAAYRAWSVLNLLGFVFTFVITALWRATSYRPELFASTEFFLLLFFALYVAVTVLNARQHDGSTGRGILGTLTFGLPAVVLSLQASIVKDYQYGLAWSALGFGLFYLAAAIGLHASRSERLRIPKLSFIAIGVVLLSLAVPLRYDDKATAATWALEGAGAVWLGLRQSQPRARFFGVLIQILAAISLVLGLRDVNDAGVWLAAGVPGALVLALAGMLSGYWLYRERAQLTKHERNVDRGAALWALGWWLYAGLAQIDHDDSASTQGLALAFIAVTALLLEAAGAGFLWAWLRTLAAAVIVPFALLGTTLALSYHPIAHGGGFGWPALFIAQYLLLRRRDHGGTRVTDDDAVAARGLHVGTLWLFLLLLAKELAWQTSRVRSDDGTALIWGLVPAVSMLPIALGRPAWPMRRDDETYRLWAAAPIVIGLCIWLLSNSFTNDGNAAPLPTLPLLNPLDLSIAAVLAAITFWWRRLDVVQRQTLTPSRTWLRPAAGFLLVFVWLNSALVRGLHYTIGTPLDPDGIGHSATVQAAFSIFWGGLGFVTMVLAARRGGREAWIGGAGLMVVVAIKLFLVDTAGTGTLARIVAFLIVGALMLVTGYLAPLPPARAEAQGAN